MLMVATAMRTEATEFEQVVIRIGTDASQVERNVADMLVRRLREHSDVGVRIEPEDEPSSDADRDLRILMGIPSHHTALTERMNKLRIAPLTDLNPGPEGFLLRAVPTDTGLTLLAAGIDPRGVLYCAGEILRQVIVGERSVRCPVDLALRTAPAFEVRGTQFGQSGVARRKAKVRPWTHEETTRVILDYALAGANTFNFATRTGDDDPMHRFFKAFDLKNLIQYCPNVGSGPPEWGATESIGRVGYLCPSVPAAREALLKKADNAFRNYTSLDYVRFNAGDGGGCECDRCKPYGKVFIELCEAMAAIVHRYHPKCEIFITNQKLDNDSDRAIFAYLREKPRPWLRAFCYGPGSDAMSWQPGHRQTHRMDLFRYPGFGPYDRYLKEILHELPPEQDIVFYNEITHWRYSQNGYVQMYPRPDLNGDLPPPPGHFVYERRPDPYLTMVYDRLTFFAWPRYYHYVFGETLRYGIGDVTHSSGHHDHFNQWMWQRLLWNPHTAVEAVVDEYARTWFGPAAAPWMARAIFQLEANLQDHLDDPLPTREGIDAYYQYVQRAGANISDRRRDDQWLWRMYMQKAAIDKYTQLAVRRQLTLQRHIENTLADAIERGDLDPEIDRALNRLAAQSESDEMRRLREQAERLGEESNAIFGVRSEGIFNLDHDFIGLGWMKRQLMRAKAADGRDKIALLMMITDYENPGIGGYYDNLGTTGYAPHLVNGSPYDHGQPYVPQMLSEANRPSQRSMAFTQHESQGVTLAYDDLDPAARYRVRFTFVRPWYQERYAMRMNQKSQSIFADDLLLAGDVELPERMSDLFTYDIPPAATRDGKLVLRLQKAKGVADGSRTEIEIWRNSGGWGTIVSEVWLLKQP
jgi:hypothetical protein